MPAFPDHVAVGFVAEDGNVFAANQIGDVLQVLLCGDSARWVVRRVQ